MLHVPSADYGRRLAELDAQFGIKRSVQALYKLALAAVPEGHGNFQIPLSPASFVEGYVAVSGPLEAF